MNEHEAAARQRAQNVAARADRPSRRRCAEDASAPARVSARAVGGLQLREAAEGRLAFEGFATVYERGYEMWDFFGPYTEVVSVGAGAASLARADLDVPFVLQHEDLRRIARTTTGTLQLIEEEEGLRVLADLDAADADVAYIAPKLRAGLVDEMSFKFRITSGNWSPDYEEYRIHTYDIHRGDVAIVGYGANPFTAGSGLRGASVEDLDAFVRDLPGERALTLYACLQARLVKPQTPRVLITDEDVRPRALRV